MPIYEYECEKCGEKFESLRHINDHDEDLKCPKCGALKPRRAMSLFSSKAAAFSTCKPASSGSG